jgi:hypothetical protein
MNAETPRLEEVVRERCAVFGVSDTIVPHVLAELRRLAESKAVATAAGPTSTKQQTIRDLQKQRRFKASQRGHARAASKALDKEVESLYKHLLTQLNKVKAGDISLRRAQARASIAFKETVKRAFQLGMKSVGLVKATGQLYDLDKNENKWVASYFNEEFGYFKKFLRQAKTQSDKQLKYRAGLYAAAMRSVYESARVLTVGPNVVITWVLQSDAPCDDCKLIARYNPYTPDTLPTTPKAGQTRCRGNCYCELRIDQVSAADVRRAKRKHLSAKTVLRKIKQQQKRRK